MMPHRSSAVAYQSAPPYIDADFPAPAASAIRCNWKHFRAQMLLQWKKLTSHDLDEAGPDRSKIALLIEEKYGIAYDLVENYLRNFEHTMLVSAAR